jgi:hypothetical protein
MRSLGLVTHVALFVVLCWGCGDSRERGPGVDSGPVRDSGGPGVDGGPGADGGPGVDGGPSVDGGPACDFVSDLERGCTTDTTCVVGVHQTDCCGNTTAIGINHSERDRFDASEAVCRETYPLCECPSGPTTTDSGETAFDTAEIRAACVARGPTMECLTYVSMRPEDAPEE